MEPYIETHSGWHVNLANPEPASIYIDDIAISLSRLARYNGHSKTVWSVASHSLLCVDIARQYFNVGDRMALHVLLHDAHEAYTGDIVSPMKYMPDIKPFIEVIELRLQRAIESAFNLEPPKVHEVRLIKTVDEYALAIEAHHLMQSKGEHWNLRPVSKSTLELFDEPVSAEAACTHFIKYFENCMRRIELQNSEAVA